MALSLGSAAAFPQPGEYVQLGVVLTNPGGAPDQYTLTAQLVNPTNGAVEGHFFTAAPGTGSQTASGSVPADDQLVVVMYAPISATAADIGGYDPSQGLSLQIVLNGGSPIVIPHAVFLALAGALAMEITGVSQVQWSVINGFGAVMYAVVSVRNPSSEIGQVILTGSVVVNGVERENWGYTTVTAQPGQTVQVPVSTAGPVTNELAGDLATPAFQLVVPNGPAIGQAVAGQGLTIPGAAQAGQGSGAGVNQGSPLQGYGARVEE